MGQHMKPYCKVETASNPRMFIKTLQNQGPMSLSKATATTQLPPPTFFLSTTVVLFNCLVTLAHAFIVLFPDRPGKFDPYVRLGRGGKSAMKHRCRHKDREDFREKGLGGGQRGQSCAWR